jgi:hypothetical protein
MKINEQELRVERDIALNNWLRIERTVIAQRRYIEELEKHLELNTIRRIRDELGISETE